MRPSTRSLCGIPMRPASRQKRLCTFFASVRAIMGCSESNNTNAMIQKVPCVNCQCCYLSSVKIGCVSAINCWKIKIRTFLTGKFVTKLTSRLGAQFEGLWPKFLMSSMNISLTSLNQWDLGAPMAFEDLNIPALETWKRWLHFHSVRRCHWSWRGRFSRGHWPLRTPDMQHKPWGGEGRERGVLTQELPYQGNACIAGSKYLYFSVHPQECISGSTPTTLLQPWGIHRQASTGPLCSAYAALGGWWWSGWA